MPDKWEQAAAAYKQGGGGSATDAAAPTGGGDDWKIWTVNAPEVKPPSLMDRAETAGRSLMGGAGDLLTGAALGVGNDVTGLLHLATKPFLSPEQYEARGERIKQLLTPENTTQAVGKGGEQAAEFLAPGLGEENALRLLPKIAEDAPLLLRMARPAARLGYQALTTGAVNKAQGGGFGTGAAMGAGGGALGEIGKAAAPYLAESALGTRLLERGGGRTGGAIGKAALEETRGLTPEAVEKSASEKIGSLYKERQGLLESASERPASLAKPRDFLSEAQGRFGPLEGGGMAAREPYGQIGEMRKSLLKQPKKMGGGAIPEELTPADYGRLQQGFSRNNLSWSPVRTLDKEAMGAGRRAYGLMTEELERTAPESVPLNRRIANLIPVEEGAGRRALSMPLAQRVMGRFGARTGALTLGGGVGYEKGGLPGAVIGAGAGAVAPELLWSPTAQMTGARLLYRAAPRFLLPAAAGGVLQLDRSQP